MLILKEGLSCDSHDVIHVIVCNITVTVINYLRVCLPDCRRLCTAPCGIRMKWPSRRRALTIWSKDAWSCLPNASCETLKDKFVSKEDLTNQAKFLATKFDIEDTMVDTNWIRHVIWNTFFASFAAKISPLKISEITLTGNSCIKRFVFRSSHFTLIQCSVKGHIRARMRLN